MVTQAPLKQPLVALISMNVPVILVALAQFAEMNLVHTHVCAQLDLTNQAKVALRLNLQVVMLDLPVLLERNA